MLRMLMAIAVVVVFSFDASAQIRINEVGTNGVDFDGASKWVELYNEGDSEVDISDLILCDFPLYPTLGELTALGGSSTTIPAGGYLVVAWADLDMGNTGDAEVGLYAAGTSDFSDDGLMLDYMQYGTAGHFREGTAQTAGEWTVDDFVAAPGAGKSLQYVDIGVPGSRNWIIADATPNAANPLSGFRISEIGVGVEFDGAMNWIEIQNVTDGELDASDLVLCDFPDYPNVRGLTALGGSSMIIPAGGFFVAAWPNLDQDNGGDSEVAIYKVDTDNFGQANLLLDYMEYGSTGHTRAGVAAEAGAWPAGEFVPAPAAGTTLQLIDSSTPGAASWAALAPTPNAANGMATSVEEAETPADFMLHSNFPNPFNPTTTISYDLSRAGQVALDVYDMLGQKVASLFEGGQAAGNYSYAWDGRDARGDVVSSGVYFYRLTLDGRTSESRVMTLLK